MIVVSRVTRRRAVWLQVGQQIRVEPGRVIHAAPRSQSARRRGPTQPASDGAGWSAQLGSDSSVSVSGRGGGHRGTNHLGRRAANPDEAAKALATQADGKLVAAGSAGAGYRT